MPGANRFYLPDTVWHITHRCHEQKFLLQFERDRLRWKYWLFQACKRYGLSVRCLVYIDLNMVRARVVDHPAHWNVCG
jgi:putative transposase